MRVFRSGRTLLLLPLLAACAASPDHGRFDRHFEAPVVGGALQEQWTSPDRAIPEVALLATIPAAFLLDDTLHGTGLARASSRAKSTADTLPIALGAGALGVGGYQWAQGDDARTFEAASEAIGITAVATEILKGTVGRKRPDSDATDSFPSGHSSFAFAATTILVREFDEGTDDAWDPLELLWYTPAMFVAVERVLDDRHWASDCAVGAFLGVFVANWVWDAHFSRDGSRRTIYTEPAKVAYRWGPGSVDGHPTFGLTISF
jgi:membrane-associated phospholipid phosphatase